MRLIEGGFDIISTILTFNCRLYELNPHKKMQCIENNGLCFAAFNLTSKRWIALLTNQRSSWSLGVCACEITNNLSYLR